MFRLMYVAYNHAKERVREERWARRVREQRVYDDGGRRAEDEPEAECAQGTERVAWPDDSVAVVVEEITVLLEDSVMGVLLRPYGGASGGVDGLCYIRARGALRGFGPW